MKQKAVILLLVFGICFLGSSYVQRLENAQSVYRVIKKESYPTVVIDAGHGGKDPGKVGVNDSLEKDINLEIALQLKSMLEQNGISVVMTREEDKDLASENATNRKNEDLRARIAQIAESGAVLTVSIHQNSFPEEDVAGAQVFYFSQSEEGKRLAHILQKQIKAEADPENHRVAKANKEYYLLKKSACPAVIVECGFLSNIREAALLTTEEYQRKIAYAIHLGILEYINTNQEDLYGDENYSD